MIKLNEKAKALFVSDSELFDKAIDTLQVKYWELPELLDTNSSRLTEIDFLNTITEHTNLPLSELIEGGKVSKLLAR